MERYIMIPIVGAIIGYATNWIAVKMLFHPRRAIYLGKWKLPFTPGVIPKGKGRLARAIGHMVEEQLLTEDVIREKLLSDSIKEGLKAKCHELADSMKVSSTTARDLITEHVEEERYGKLTNEIETQLATHIYHGILEFNLGSVIAEKLYETVQEKIMNTMFGMFINDQFILSIKDQAEESLNHYIEEKGYDYILEYVKKESELIQNKQISEGVLLLEQYDIPIGDIFVTYYERMVDQNLQSALQQLNLAGLVEDKINAMDVKEVENLVLTVMQKELGTIVNLGALIGLILGLINVAILLV